MKTSTLFLAASLAVLPLFGQSSGMLEKVSPRQHGPIRIRQHRLDGSVTSDNWSGFAVTGATDSVTAVEGSWIVPTVTCGSPGPTTGASAFWVGIDGYTSDTVEQTGTDSDCAKGTPDYYAWYEFYPEPSFNIKMNISPGDVMSASVTYSGEEFTVAINNLTTGARFTKSAKVASAKRNSAEWIAEAPSSITGVLPLPDFGTVFFGDDSTGVAGTCDAVITKRHPIGGFPSSSIVSITMVSSSGSTEAQPSTLSSDGTSFSVEWF